MKTKVILAFILSVVLAYLTREIIGDWLVANYIYSGSFVGFGSSQNSDGFLFSYIFFSSLFGFVLSEKYSIALFLSVPVLLLNIALGFVDPQLWLSLLLLALGLGLAWLILKLKAYFFPKATPPGSLG